MVTKNKPDSGNSAENLRARAEQLMATQCSDQRKLSLTDTQKLVHKLQVHQIELELQNEELRRAQETIEEARNRYADLFDFAPVGYFILDEKGLIVEANLTGARMVGIERDRLLNTPFLRLVALSDQSVFNHHLKEVFNNDSKQTCELTIEPRGGPGGPAIYASMESIPAHDDQSHITHCRAIVADITFRKQAQDALESEKRNEFLRTGLEKTIIALTTTTEMRDPYTSGHQRRVAQLASSIAQEMGISGDRLEGMRVMGLLHDIGMMAVPLELLSKPGRISEFELGIIRGHVLMGYKIVKGIDFPWPVAQTVLQHLERLDGSGYPAGLSGQDIIQEARILMVANVVDSIAFDKPYRQALGIDAALDEIIKNKGILYDAEVVEACVKLLTEKEFKFEA